MFTNRHHEQSKQTNHKIFWEHLIKTEHALTRHMAYQFYSYIIPTGLCTCICQKTYAGMFPAVLLAIAPN